MDTAPQVISFDDAYQQFFPLTVGMARKWIGHSEAEDVAQEVFVALHHKFSTLTSCDAPTVRAWLKTCTKRIAGKMRTSRDLKRQRQWRVLNEQQVRVIKLTPLHLSTREMGEIFDVDPTTIYAIRRGKTWRHVPGEPLDRTPARVGRSFGRQILTEKQVRIIRSIGHRMTGVELARVFGVSVPTIDAIRSNRNWLSPHRTPDTPIGKRRKPTEIRDRPRVPDAHAYAALLGEPDRDVR